MTTNWLHISNCVVGCIADALALEQIALAFLIARNGKE